LEAYSVKQQSFFHEDIYEALSTDISAAGGPKVVGHKLRPTMKPDGAGEWLKTCLNRNRAEKLSPEDVMLIKRLAREVGSFAALTFEMSELNMTMPTPVEPEDERARLQREFIQAVSSLKQIEKQLGKVC
jgi:hypothetical protein